MIDIPMRKGGSRMDSRIGLKPNTKLQLQNKENGTIVYYIIRELSRGGSCIVYEASEEMNSGDKKIIRLKECYPYALNICREDNGVLVAKEDSEELFGREKERFLSDFSTGNNLFYTEELYDVLVSPIDSYKANNTIYIAYGYSSKQTLREYHPSSIKECISLVKQVAYIISQIHKKGYLYLDIKPDNVLVVDGLQKRVKLFDFNSMIPLERIGQSDDTNEYLSYSEGYAPVELQLSQWKKIGSHTDIFGIGALLFYLLFGRTPRAFDCEVTAEYAFVQLSYDIASCDDKIFLSLTQFFHHSLANYYKERYQSMETVVGTLSNIETYADPLIPRIYSSKIEKPKFVFGRENELYQLNKCLKHSNGSSISIIGTGGIGKSTLIRQYIAQFRNEYDTVLYLQFQNSLEQTICDDYTLQISTVRRQEREKLHQYFYRKLATLRQLIYHKKAILVIDNVTGEVDKTLCDILEVGWSVILVSREKLSYNFDHVIKVEEISNERDLTKLFVSNLAREITNQEIPYVKEMIQQVQGHTLVIELIAKQIASSHFTIEQANELVKQYGFSMMAKEKVSYEKDRLTYMATIGTIIDELFQVDSLTDEKKVILKIGSILGVHGMNIHLYQTLLQLSTKDSINQLIKEGWLSLEKEKIGMHPVIKEAVRRWEWNKQYQENAGLFFHNFYKEIKKQRILHERENLHTLLFQVEEIIYQCKQEKIIQKIQSYQTLRCYTVCHMPRYREEFILTQASQMLKEYRKQVFTNRDNGLREKPTISSVIAMKLYQLIAIIYEERGELDKAYKTIMYAWKIAEKENRNRLYAQYYDMLSKYYDVKLNGAYDTQTKEEERLKENLLDAIEKAIQYSESLKEKDKEQLYATNLLAKATILIRSNTNELNSSYYISNKYNENTKTLEIKRLLDLAKDNIQMSTTPYSPLRHQYCLVRGWYYALILQNVEQTERAIKKARKISRVIMETDLDEIDSTIVPCANMYLELAMYEQSKQLIFEAITICEEYGLQNVYVRKKEELYRYLLDIAYLSNDALLYNKINTMLDMEKE